MSGTRDRQRAAYFRHLPRLIAQERQGWALVAREEVVDVFQEFDSASSYADSKFPDEDVLIRHTSEQRGMAPFIVSRR